ncbi:hypothetical protein NPIL_689241 [Nephila pilipes]|uniref:Uncharacterized protein n=1 Tax=Nephila pilipes TaxID=299642 RepID=A0A8X6T260_NEPPI|nr:hypothetical protein NPIL_689241 [Nephila pilipes]
MNQVPCSLKRDLLWMRVAKGGLFDRGRFVGCYKDWGYKKEVGRWTFSSLCRERTAMYLWTIERKNMFLVLAAVLRLGER